MGKLVSDVRRLRVSLTNEEIGRLLYENYETAAINRGWKPNLGDPYMAWSFVPEENKAAWRDAAIVIRRIIKEDEEAKYDNTEEMQSDLQMIMKELGISIHARQMSPHAMVQNEILPKIRKMKKTLVDVRTTIGENFVGVMSIIDEGKTL
jgi:hypothetical protein